MVGQTLAHYKILDKIGAGGMGEVYLAEDEKLDRKVALKVLPADLAGDAERRARFTREAKAVAALNHPNIVTIYSVEEADGIHFITMELVEGKTLAELLPKRGFDGERFYDIAVGISGAVAAAHQVGIIHRDLKPPNIMVADDGRLKILDFGLAKLRPDATAGLSEQPTQSAEGAVVGTVAYMSPEQAEGKAVDARSDIYSLGIIFYEMATGVRPFEGILRETPTPVTARNPNVASGVAKLIRRCLASEPDRRYQTALDVRNELEEVGAEPEIEERATRKPRTAWLVAAAIVLVAAGWVARALSTTDRAMLLTNPVRLTSAPGVEDYPTWSPDGRTLAYAAMEAGTLARGNWDIWVVNASGGSPVNRTEDHTGTDTCPSWSPDGSQIAFWSNRDGPGYYVMSALGGAPKRVLSSAARLPTPPRWSNDGRDLAGIVNDNGVFVEIVSLDTRVSKRYELPGRSGQRLDLSWFPERQLFAYIDTGGHDNDVTQLWVLNTSDNNAFPVSGSRTKVWSPHWSMDGSSLTFLSNRGGSMDLWRQRVDATGEPHGDPTPVTAGMIIRRAAFSPGTTKLAYSRGRRFANLWRVPILTNRRATWDDGEQLTFDEAHLEYIDVSPDTNQLVVAWDRAGNRDIWTLSLIDGEMTQITTELAPDWHPSWSTDGLQIGFTSYRSGNRELWVVPVGGGLPAQQLTDDVAHSHWYPFWSPDAREIAYTESDSRGVEGIRIMPSEGGKARLVTTSGGGSNGARFSSDGEWLITRSEGRVARVRTSGGDPEILTAREGWFPRWSADGARVFFVGVDERGASDIWEVLLEDGSERQLTDLSGKNGGLVPTALATDGQFLYFAWEENVGDIWVMDVVEGDL